MNTFLSSNEAVYRLARTIIQGIIGVIIANLDLIVGLAPIPASVKPLIVALVMACLSPIMAYLGGKYDGIGDDEIYAMGPGEDLLDDCVSQEPEVYQDEEVLDDEQL